MKFAKQRNPIHIARLRNIRKFIEEIESFRSVLEDLSYYFTEYLKDADASRIYLKF